MIINLSRLVQRAAQPRLMKVVFCNGLHAHLTAGTVVFLLALNYGASDTVMGLLYAAMHITGLFAVLTPMLLSNRETTAIWAGFWWARAVIGLGFLALPFFSPDLKVWGLVVVYYIFLSCRAMGMTATMSIFKALCAPRDLPAVMARTMIQFNAGSLVIAIIVYLSLWQEWFGAGNRTLFGLIAIGLVINFFTAWLIGGLPRTGYLDPGSANGLRRAAREIFATPQYRELVWLTLLQTALAVCTAYMLSYLKNVAGLSNDGIFFMTILGMGGAIAISSLIRAIGVRISERVLFFGAHAILCGLGLAWAFLKHLPLGDDYRVLVVLWVFVAIGLTGSGAVMMQLKGSRLPSKGSIQFTVIYLLVAVVGSVVAIGAVRLLALIDISHWDFLHPYSLVFLVWSGLSLSICLFSLQMRRGDGENFVEQLALLSPVNLRTFYQAYQVETHSGTHGNRWNVIEGLMVGGSLASRRLLLEAMQSPDTRRRYSALRMLNNDPNDEAFPYVFAEAQAVNSPLRYEAITTLGFLNNQDAIPVVREFLADPDMRVQSCAVKTLLRLGADLTDAEIEQVYSLDCPTRTRWELFIGIAEAGKYDLLFQMSARELAAEPDEYWSTVIFLHLADARNRRASLTELFEEERAQAGAGLAYFQAEFGERLPEDLTLLQLEPLFTQARYSEIEARLKTAGNAEWVHTYDRLSALGCLYIWGLSALDNHAKR